MADETPALYAVMVRKLNAWAISGSARAVGMELAALSFGADMPEVEIWQRELAMLTGCSEGTVSDAVAELLEGGVLQVRGGRGKVRVFRLLPNAEYIEPARLVDETAARMLREEIFARNIARRPGDDPGGQGVLLATSEEALRDELARGSVERALEPLAIEQPGRLTIGEIRRRIAESPLGEPSSPERSREPEPVAASSLGRSREGSPSPARIGAGPKRLTFNGATHHVERERGDAGCGPGRSPTATDLPPRAAVVRLLSDAADPDAARYAWELVREVAEPSEFRAYDRRWAERAAQEPEIVAEVAADCRARMKAGEEIPKPGGWVFVAVRDIVRAVGRTLRIL